MHTFLPSLISFCYNSREKLVLDMLAAAGGATLSGSWTRVFINNEAYGLFLLMDDASTHFIDNILHGGDWKSPNTGNLQCNYILNIFVIYFSLLFTPIPLPDYQKI